MTSPWLASAAIGATGRTFEIRTVSDFLKVPEDRRRVCLREFDAWLHMAEAVPALLSAAGEALNKPLPAEAIQMDTEAFRWVDDGEGCITVSIEAQPPQADTPRTTGVTKT